MSKTAVSALQEYCAKNGIGLPNYSILEDNEGVFICQIELLNFKEIGEGRSKRDAKFDATINAIKKMRKDHPGIEFNVNEQSKVKEMPTAPANVDMIIKLRDYCVVNNYPLPQFSIVEQKGTPDSPLFTYECSVATIVRFGTAEKKKEARQKAAWEMFNAISIRDNPFASDPKQFQVCNLDDAIVQQDEERFRKFKTYRELTEADLKEVPATKVTDKHNFFANFHDELKKDAFLVINDEKNFTSNEEKARAILRALKLKPSISTVETVTGNPFMMIELDCLFDTVFVNDEQSIWDEIIEYFKEMLVLADLA